MKIKKSQLRRIIQEEQARLIADAYTRPGDIEDDYLPHEKHPSDVAVDLSSVLPALAMRQRDAGELTPQKFLELKEAFKLVHNFLKSVPRA